MSAYIVDKTHIDLLVTAAEQLSPQHYGGFRWYHGSDRQKLNYENRHEVGIMLWSENLASVMGRYPDDKDGERPGPADFTDTDVLGYRFAEVPGVTNDPRLIAVVAKAIDGYEYQSCEHDGWEASSAAAFCTALRRLLLKQLPTYEEADAWEFTDRNLLIKMRRALPRMR